MIQKLVDIGCDINAKDEHGRTAIWELSLGFEPETMKLLIKNGADIYAKGSFSDKDTSFLDFMRKQKPHNSDGEKTLKLLNEADKNLEYQKKRKEVLVQFNPDSEITNSSLAKVSKSQETDFGKDS